MRSGLIGMVGLPGVSGRTFGARGEERGGLPLDTLQLGIAGYSFLHVPLDGAIAMMKRVGVDNLSIKDFHLPLDSSPETIQQVSEKFRTAGIRIYAAGVIYMKTQAEVDRAFDYAHALGVDLIIGVPNPELLGYTEQKVKATGIRVAIHNHGPEDKLYPSPVDVYNHIKDLDPRMGLCLDIGHAARAGADPAPAGRARGGPPHPGRDHRDGAHARSRMLSAPRVLKQALSRRYDDGVWILESPDPGGRSGPARWVRFRERRWVRLGERRRPTASSTRSAS